MQIKSLKEQLEMSRHLNEKEQNKSMERDREIQLIRDFYTDQYERSINEQMKYLTKVSLQIETFQNPKISRFKEKFSRTFQSLDEIKSHLDKQMIQLQSFDRSFLNLTEQKQKESLTNQIAHFLSTIEPIFNRIFLSDVKQSFPLNSFKDSSIEPVMNKLYSFIENLYEKIQKQIRDKIDLNDQYSILRRKQKIFSEWERKLYESIDDPKCSFDYFKGLVEKMATKLDQVDQNGGRRSTITSQISTTSTIEYNPVNRFVLLRKHF